MDCFLVFAGVAASTFAVAFVLSFVSSSFAGRAGAVVTNLVVSVVLLNMYGQIFESRVYDIGNLIVLCLMMAAGIAGAALGFNLAIEARVNWNMRR